MEKDRYCSVLINAEGERINGFDLTPDHVDLDHIATSLSNLCRFNGSCKKFYSVAEHCVHLARLVPSNLFLYALFHDAVEAYTGDFVYPIKRYINETTNAISSLEEHIESTIFKKYGVPTLSVEDKIVFTEFDRAFGRREGTYLFGPKFSYMSDPKSSLEILSRETLERINTRELHCTNPSKARDWFISLANFALKR